MSSYSFDWEKFLLRPASVPMLAAALMVLSLVWLYPKQFLWILKSLKRNLRRTILSGLAIIILVVVVTMIWSVLSFLDSITSEKSEDFKAIVTERWQLPSQMPYAYAATLGEGAASKPTDLRPRDHMTWQFYGGTVDPNKRTFEGIIFFFSMDPAKLETMMDGLTEKELGPENFAQLKANIRAMQTNKRGVMIGPERLKKMEKKIGERLTITGLNYKDINLEVEIIGTFPPGRYDQSAILHRDYLNDAMDVYNAAQKRAGKPPHPLTEKSLNLVWFRVPNSEEFRQIAEQIMNSSQFSNPAVKVETASSGIASFLDAYRDLLWGVRWLLVPAILVTMALVIANAISISVRERRPEMAVMKVLGFGPGQIMALVLGEALLVGVGCGLISSFGTWYLINEVAGGFKFPIAFFPAFLIPDDALWWGAMVGGLTSLAGSILPAWSARSVKVSEVFSKIS